MFGRISSTLPYHTLEGPTRILPIFTTKVQVLPYFKPVNTPYCCTVLYPTFTKTFPYLTHNSLLTCPIWPYPILSIKSGVRYCMVEWEGVGIHIDNELITDMLHVLYVIS